MRNGLHSLVLIATGLLLAFCAPLPAQDTPADITISGFRPDTTYINLLRAVDYARLEVRLTGGEVLTGKATVTDNGLVITERKLQSITRTERKVHFVPWSSIESLRAIRKGSTIPTAVVVAATAGFFFMFLLVLGFSSD